MASDPTPDELVLAGDAAYDGLDAEQQEAVRAVWDQQIGQRAADLDLTVQFIQAGVGWVEADPDGNVVIRRPGATDRPAATG